MTKTPIIILGINMNFRYVDSFSKDVKDVQQGENQKVKYSTFNPRAMLRRQM